MSENLLRCFGQERRKKNSYKANAFKQIVKHGAETGFLTLILCKCPRGCLVDIFVAALCKREYCVKRIADPVFRKKLVHLADSLNRKSFQLTVKLLGYVARLNNAVKILVRHSDSSVNEIAECVCKVGIVAFDHVFVCD